MIDTSDCRLLQGSELIAAFRSARKLTIAASSDLTDEQWCVPFDPGIQPMAWDLAHIGWVAEFWMLRGPHGINHDGTIAADIPARLIEHDDRYDSARIAHRARWLMPLYKRDELYSRLEEQLQACIEHIEQAGSSDDDLYLARLALYHEFMHHEAMLWTRDMLGYAAVEGYAMPSVEPREPVDCPGGKIVLGRSPETRGFAFDNEVPPHHVTLAPFSIDATLVTNGRFLEFVEANGYGRTEFWPGPAGAFRSGLERNHPARWRQAADGSFEQRWFDQWRPLAPDEPVCHVSAYEAEAFCRFVGRRLPSAAEWETAADQITWGHTVWEWTATPFAPYPGFRPGPYTTYSTPWFHKQREMRGGAFATDALIHNRAYRNFFLPQRTDVFAGFRTAGD